MNPLTPMQHVWRKRPRRLITGKVIRATKWYYVPDDDRFCCTIVADAQLDVRNDSMLYDTDLLHFMVVKAVQTVSVLQQQIDVEMQPVALSRVERLARWFGVELAKYKPDRLYPGTMLACIGELHVTDMELRVSWLHRVFRKREDVT